MENINGVSNKNLDKHGNIKVLNSNIEDTVKSVIDRDITKIKREKRKFNRKK